MRKALVIALLLIFSANAHAVVKIRDIAKVEGIRDNQLVGFGLVVGLNGTGDKDQTKITVQSLTEMLERSGVSVDKTQIKVKNVASVTVTATLPPFARRGQTIDVIVSSVGDAKSLEGGTLILTPLKAPNGEIYAVAQGPISVGGLNASAGGSSVTKNHPTVGRIPNGAIVENEVNFQMGYVSGNDFGSPDYFNLYFNEYSLGNVVNAKNVINSYIGSSVATITSPSNIQVNIPLGLGESFYEFLNTVLNLEIQPEGRARVVMNERTGTIVMGSDVRISTVAVAHGNLTITITNQVEVSQPNSFSEGQTVVTQQPIIEMAEDSAKLMVVPEGVTIGDLVKALNAIGVSPRDLISIIQVIRSAGALHANLELI